MQEQASAGFWLSPQQKLAWRLQQEALRKPARAACLVSLRGGVDAARLQESLRELVARHEILRTVFRRQTGMKVPFQVVLETAGMDWEQVRSVRDLDALFVTEQFHEYNADAGPVLRAVLVSAGQDQSVLILSVPFMCADARSLEILVRELAAIYSGQRDTLAEPFRYVQFAQWQGDLIESEEDDAKQARGFWDARVPVSTPALPFERKSEDAAFQPESLVVPVAEQLMRAISAREDGRQILLAALECLMYRLSGLTSFTVGVFSDNREYEELENAIGGLGRTLPLRAQVKGDFSFSDVLRQISDELREATALQEYFVPEAIGLDGDMVAFSFLDIGANQASGAGFELQQVFVVSERFKLRLSVVRRESGIELEFQYDASRLERQAVERIAGYYVNLLTAAVANPALAVAKLPLLSENEREQLLVEWNATSTEFPAAKCLHELFEAQAARVPERVAVRCGEVANSYRELNERANQLARYLRKNGVGPDRPVGLCLERSAETMVAVLAILKAGGAYVPLNPDNPPARLRQQLAGAAAIITEAKLSVQISAAVGQDASIHVVTLDRDQQKWANEAKTNLASNANPENLVYVIYTSGSTGVPKGVAVRHRNLVNYSDFITKRLDLNKYPEGLQFATVSTLGADLGNTCIYPALISGGTLHIVGYEMATDPRSFAAYVSAYPIDVLKIVPSHLQALVHSQSEDAAKLLPRKYLIFGGETLTPKLLEKIATLHPSCEILNHYGPTETTVGSLTLKLKEYDWEKAKLASIPIGRPIQNTQLYVLDANLEPVPIGVVGELYIAGVGVTAGYLGQAEKTAERFVKNPFATDAEIGTKMYRTGDLVRYGADGNVEFLGRGDDQVKVRGFRIELGEIEAVLARHAGVKQVAMLVREDAQGEKRMLAYVVPSRESLGTSGPITGEDLRAYLKEQLPDYMVPQAVVVMAKMPLNANGKIDRQALPEPEQAHAAREIVEPRNETEQALLEVWQRVLHKQQIGVTDNFFDLGGHSLLAVQLMGEIKKDTGKEIPLASLFRGATIEYLAALLQGAEKVDKSILREIQTRGSRPAFFSGVLPGVNALGYLNLSKYLGPEQPFYMLQAAGPGPRAARRPYTAQEYEKVASEYIGAMRTVQPEGPYHIGGMCEGARIVLEMARLLEAQGQKVNLLAIFDTWALENTQNPHLWRIHYYSRRVQDLRRLPWGSRMNLIRRAVINRLRWWLGSKSAPPKSEWMETYWPGEDFVPWRVQCRITIFKVPKQPFYYQPDPLLGWGARTESGVDAEMVTNGKHRLLLREPYVRELAAALAHTMERLYPKNGDLPPAEEQSGPHEVAAAL